MSRKRYGGFSDPEPELEASNEVITEIEETAEPEVVKEVITEIEETAEPVTFDEENTAESATLNEEKTAELIMEPVEPIEAEVGEEQDLEVAPVQEVTPNLPYKITITINALNIRTGPGSSYQAVGITKKGSVHKVLEEQDGWGRIGDNKWINLSKRFVEKD